MEGQPRPGSEQPPDVTGGDGQTRPPGADELQGPDPAFLDRMLGEDIRNDYEFTVSFVVLLDPPAFTPGAEPAAPAETPAQPAASAR